MTAQRTAGTIALVSGGALLVLAILSSVIGLASGASAWTSGGGATTTAMGPWMMGGTGMMGGGMGAGMMGSGHMGAFGGTSSGTTAPIAGAPTATLTATEFAFSPTEITLAASGANLSLVNKGAVLHDLTIPALGVRVTAAAGQTATVGLRGLPAGRYAAYCSVPGHAEAGMRISVVVQ